jgi:hypothetical protein
MYSDTAMNLLIKTRHVGRARAMSKELEGCRWRRGDFESLETASDRVVHDR